MLSVDRALAQCTGYQTADACVAQIVSALDLTGDGGLNRAELSRIFRAAVLYSNGMAEDWVLTEEATVSLLAVSPMAPVLASVLLGSFDYSGDGSLDAAEISADRFTATLTRDLTAALPNAANLDTMLERQLSTLLPLLKHLANQ